MELLILVLILDLTEIYNLDARKQQLIPDGTEFQQYHRLSC